MYTYLGIDCQNISGQIRGRHSIEVAFELHTQHPRAQISTLPKFISWILERSAPRPAAQNSGRHNQPHPPQKKISGQCYEQGYEQNQYLVVLRSKLCAHLVEVVGFGVRVERLSLRWMRAAVRSLEKFFALIKF